MKRWAIVLVTVLCIIFTGNVYAEENIESQEILNDGRLVLNFLSMDTDAKSSPVSNVKVEIFYVDNNLIDIRELEELKNVTINLVSDENGIVIINYLPYGLYQYRIISAPEGFEYSSDINYFVIDLMDKDIKLNVNLDKKIQMAEGGEVVKEIPIEEEKEETPIIEIKPPQEELKDEVIQEKENIQVENNEGALKTNLNKLSIEIYSYDEDSQENIVNEENILKEKKDKDVVPEEVIKNTIVCVRERIRKSQYEMIQKFKEYKLSDSIKIAINTINSSMHDYSKFIIDKLDDENKRLKKIDKVISKVNKINEEKKYKCYAIRMKAG